MNDWSGIEFKPEPQATKQLPAIEWPAHLQGLDDSPKWRELEFTERKRAIERFTIANYADLTQ